MAAQFYVAGRVVSKWQKVDNINFIYDSWQNHVNVILNGVIRVN